MARQWVLFSQELRGATSLAKLIESTGCKSEAWSLLSEVYDRFEGGFETADLLDAKELLDSL